MLLGSTIALDKGLWPHLTHFRTKLSKSENVTSVLTISNPSPTIFPTNLSQEGQQHSLYCTDLIFSLSHLKSFHNKVRPPLKGFLHLNSVCSSSYSFVFPSTPKHAQRTVFTYSTCMKLSLTIPLFTTVFNVSNKTYFANFSTANFISPEAPAPYTSLLNILNCSFLLFSKGK